MQCCGQPTTSAVVSIEKPAKPAGKLACLPANTGPRPRAAQPHNPQNFVATIIVVVVVATTAKKNGDLQFPSERYGWKIGSESLCKPPGDRF